MSGIVRVEARVEGIVQGVGFRPYAHALARRLGLAGRVGNDGAGVFLELEGESERVEDFLTALRRQPPPLAVVERVRHRVTAPRGAVGFEIVGSDRSGPLQTLVSPDVATCADCLRELFDPGDRRYRYPFINCVNCGPRYTIVAGLPYDRSGTTMRGFAMCARCEREYHDPGDRRFHAQPACCPACGPRLVLRDRHGRVLAGDPSGAGDAALAEAVRRLAAGQVVAIKGLGGYHLAVDATNEPAVAALRARKRREQKPFAMMVADLTAAGEVCQVDAAGAALLTSPRGPIVLLPRAAGAAVAASVAPGERRLGMMLPYTGLHHLLLRELARPLVLTSGNLSDEPIAHTDPDALARLGAIADAFLTHDRPIHTRVDDSVSCTFRGRELVLRRSRGYAPRPVPLPRRLRRPVLGCGAELKNTFCLARERHALVSHHIGDLADYATLRSYTAGIAHWERLFDVAPQVLAFDLHPEYLSTKYALERAADHPELTLVGVQHHHAHIVSCLVDNGWASGPVLGVAFDGLGYGSDGTLWGGELLVADYARFTRAGHLAPVRMPGGTTAIRQPWRMAVSYLDATGGLAEDLPVLRRHADQWPAVRDLLARGTAAPVTTSAGRLFDAVAAILDLPDQITYEGQAAIALEQLADPSETGAYPVRLGDGDPVVLDTMGLVRAVVEQRRRGVPAPVVAARFHRGLAGAVVAACRRLRESTGVGTVALSGGVFQNLLLLESVVDGLERARFRVLTHSRVPPNDGGISLGQVAVAGARAAAAG